MLWKKQGGKCTRTKKEIFLTEIWKYKMAGRSYYVLIKVVHTLLENGELIDILLLTIRNQIN